MAFAPFPGIVSSPSVPEHPAVRFDSLLYEGYTVPPFYDSLLGKLVVHGADRQACPATLREALGSLEIGGLKTTIPLHVLLSRDADVVAGATHTRFLKNWLDRHFGQ